MLHQLASIHEHTIINMLMESNRWEHTQKCVSFPTKTYDINIHTDLLHLVIHVNRDERSLVRVRDLGNKCENVIVKR